MKIYIVKVNSISDADFDFMLKILPAKRQERILRQRIKQNADNMLVGSLLARYAIKTEFGIPIAEQIFDTGEHGKPLLKNFSDIHFNVSHSGQCVACAVADIPIGIDVQKLTDFNMSLAERVCNEKELAQILTSADKASEFVKLWTQKEAYVKWLGCGIASYDLKNVPCEEAETVYIDGYYISIYKKSISL